MSSDHDDSRHPGSEHYVRTLRGEQSPSLLARLIHDHLVRTCPDCGRAFEQLGTDREGVRAILGAFAGESDEEERSGPEETAPAVPPLAQEVRRVDAALERLRRARIEARREFRALRDLSHEERLGVIERSVARFRSRALAEVLLEESRDRVRRAPADAASLAALVPRVLEQTPDAEGEPWLAELRVRAGAREANALRVAGDLEGAHRRFAALRGEIAADRFDERRTLAEVASLEASLRIEQRRFAEALDLLERATLLFRRVGDEGGRARSLVKMGNLLADIGKPKRGLGCLNKASGVLGSGLPPGLRLSSVNGVACALIELGRFGEARAHVEKHLDLYDDSDDLQAGAKLRHLQAKIAAGLGELAEAAALLESSCEAFLHLGLPHYAADVFLDLAQVFLQAGRLPELARLAAQLVEIFDARDVQREKLATLRLLARACARERLTAELADRLAERLAGVRSAG